VDPQRVLRAAERAIGTPNLRCATFFGTGSVGAVRRQKEAGINIDWPRIDPLANHTRTIHTFYNHVWRLGLDVQTIVPIHGKPTPWRDFLKIVEPSK
jgi:hypothetical protein